MLDLETVSARGHAVILIIAGVKFGRDRGISKEIPPFYRKISRKSCEERGMHTDPKTIQWWQDQNEEIRKEAFEGERIGIKQALQEFSDWFGKSDRIWSNGATFDIPILSEAYARCDMVPPWKYYQARDTRTLYELAGISSKDLPKDNLHNALQDCHRQVWGVVESLRRLKEATDSARAVNASELKKSRKV